MSNSLKEIQQGIYNKTLKEEDVLEAIRKAKEDIQSDIQNFCEHNYVYKEGSTGYGFEECSKCGKLKN